MTSEYILRFDNEESAKATLKPFGFVSDSPTFGECWAISIQGRHLLSNMFKGEGYWLKLNFYIDTPEGFEEAVTHFINKGE